VVPPTLSTFLHTDHLFYVRHEDTLQGQPDYKKEYEKGKDRFRFSLGVSAGSPLYSFRPEATASVGIGRGNWQVITGVGYSADGPKLSLGFQWTF